MPKSSNQKLKLLYLMRILLQGTDEQHPMTVNDMIAALESLDISAERKSIYDDLDALESFGLDIVRSRSGRSSAYYIGAREFEMPELKLLVDSVQSSKFITQRKTLSLIKKIEGLANKYDAQLLQRQVYVQNRVKTMNESVYYNVDEISAAISTDRQISFRYFDYSVSRERCFRKEGGLYRVSPFALMWDHENYYMLAYDPESSLIKHYRVDRMTDISPVDEMRDGLELFAQIDMSKYSSRVFSMFSGEDQTVRLRFASRLASAIIDRFGADAVLVSDSNANSFTCCVSVSVSPQFFGWLFGFGDEAELLSPQSARDEYSSYIKRVLSLYSSESGVAQ